jgi:hypothetical protein
VSERHPESGLPMVEEGGAWRVLGCLPPPLGASPQMWEASRGLPPSQFKECNLHTSFPIIKTDDQAQSQSCVGHAIEKIWSYNWLQSGMIPKDFSPTFIYGLINHGVDRGASLTDGMNALKLFGIAESSYVPEGMIFRSQFPSGAVANAKRYKPVETLRITSYDDICSAITLGQPVATGILVGENFGKLDDQGICPVPETPVGGHAIALVGLSYCKKLEDWVVLMHNSWGMSWGLKDETGQGGFAKLCRKHFERYFFDTWAIGGVMSDPDDPADDLPVARS